jgi:nucleoside-diphosphate-sugar epimerase
MKSILITGINGFVGSHIYGEFVDKYHLFGIDTFHDKKKNIPQISWNEIHPKLPGDIIIHLAGVAHDTEGVLDESQYYSINVGLTKKIFDLFLSSQANIFVYFSSVKAVADTVRDGILHENAYPNPKTAYGKSKLAAEKYLLSRNLPEGKHIYILRPAMIHGPGNKGNLNLLYSLVEKGIPYPLGAFPNKRSFLSTENMTYIIDRLINMEATSGVYNICDDEPLSTIQIVKMIYNSFYRTDRILNIPKELVRLIAYFGGLMKIPLTTERLKKMTESYVVSNNKIKKVLAITSLPTSSENGMFQTIKSFHNNKYHSI